MMLLMKKLRSMQIFCLNRTTLDRHLILLKIPMIGERLNNSMILVLPTVKKNKTTKM